MNRITFITFIHATLNATKLLWSVFRTEVWLRDCAFVVVCTYACACVLACVWWTVFFSVLVALVSSVSIYQLSPTRLISYSGSLNKICMPKNLVGLPGNQISRPSGLRWSKPRSHLSDLTRNFFQCAKILRLIT